MSEDEIEIEVDIDSVLIVGIDNVHAYLATENVKIMDGLRKHFSIRVKNFQFLPLYKAGKWDGFIRFIKANGLIPRGLVGEVIELLKEWEFPCRIQGELYNGLDISNFQDTITRELISKQSKTLEPYPHQWEVCERLLSVGRGIARSATSSGKSYMVTMVQFYLRYMGYIERTLLIVPKTDLVVQMQRDAIEYGEDPNNIGLYFGAVKDEDKPLMIATWQSLQNIDNHKYFEQFDCVICDEVHLGGHGSGGKQGKKSNKASGTKIKQIMDLCVNAKYRFGVTGTLPEEEVDRKTVKGCFGDVLIEVKANDLMEKGHVSQLEIVIPFLSYKNKKDTENKINELYEELYDNAKTNLEGKKPVTLKFLAERKFIEKSLVRMKYIAKLCNAKLKKEKNMLILVNTVEYGEKMKTALELLCKDASLVTYIHGGVDVNERTKIRQKMEETDRCIVIATTSLFSTGISVKNLHVVIFANAGQSKISTLQAIGRSLRKHESKECACVIDLVDDLTYTVKHSEKRIEFYETEGFEYRIIEVDL